LGASSFPDDDYDGDRRQSPRDGRSDVVVVGPGARRPVELIILSRCDTVKMDEERGIIEIALSARQ